jgi:hypothetical protein
VHPAYVAELVLGQPAGFVAGHPAPHKVRDSRREMEGDFLVHVAARAP